MRWWDKRAEYGLYEPRFEHDNCGVGFVCHIKGKRSHGIVEQALEVLKRLAHRGAVGADPDTGDGAGILLQIPHDFFQKAAEKSKISLPGRGDYGTGLVFLPKDIEERLYCKDIFYKIIKKEEQVLLGWRAVKVDGSAIGKTARKTQPVIGQVFIGKGKNISGQLEFERKLYLIRKEIENAVRKSVLKQKHFFHIASLSSRTFVYKGLFMPRQLEGFFPELKDESLESAVALVHSRYSTNTFPEWSLAQPFRFLAHNGEINTLRGNINWMKAREGQLDTGVFGKDIKRLKPILTPDLSDSAAIDNAFEFLVLGGKPLYQAMMMLIPAAWENNSLLDKKSRDFYQYQACSCEPWDGPAAIAFTDGRNVGAVLDRNGLRPARYIITKDNRIIMASEAGVLDIDPADILVSGRIEPGRMLYIDTENGRVVGDAEIKKKAAESKPYGKWLKDNMLELDSLPANQTLSGRYGASPSVKTAPENNQDIFILLKAFGYSREDLKTIIGPMAQKGVEPTGSMGNDTPLAVLSQKPQLLYGYFKQLFAQVTNPAIDPIREECVMSLESFLGPQANILEEAPLHCRRLRVKNPVLTDEELLKIKEIKTKGFRAKPVSILFDTEKEGDFTSSLERVCREAVLAINEGYSFIILSDRAADKKYSALPALLSTGALHQYLVKRSLRTRVSIIVESAEPREVHHFALLFGYGADCVNPYLAYQAVAYMVEEGLISLGRKQALENYREATVKGILKILSKMGISTLQSYKGAQIFEALGLDKDVINRCFAGTVSRIGGADFGIIEQEVLSRHFRAFSENNEDLILDTGGLYQWKKDGEFHLWRPQSIAALQDAARTGDYQKYKEFAKLIDEQSGNPTTLRGLLKFKKVKPVPIEEVEPAKDIFKRFATGAMSFGSISKGAHETLALAMNRLGGKSNTGEGGEDPERFKPPADGSSKRSAIKQVASGRFGVTTNYLVNADEIQIKIAQGAKPGEGGQLPGHKVSVDIARIRYTTPGVTLISPPPHHDIYSIEDLAQLIFDLKNVNPKARISVKLVSETGVGTVAAGVAKGHADMILISGGDGGTGASPISSIRHAGLPWELGLAETHQTLVLNNLRSRVRLQADGQMRTAKDVAVAAILGAEEFGFCTAPLIVLGCVMLRHCHLNNCSVGVATQDRELGAKFKGEAGHIENYFHFIARELREIMAQLGVRKIDELIGRTDLLEVNNGILPWKAKKVDYSRILFKPEVPKSAGLYCSVKQEHGIDKVLDRKLIKLAEPALSGKNPVKHTLEISSTNRTAGAMLSGKICSLFGEKGLKDGAVHFKFKGIAGQSFGAWLACGVVFELEGLANDYVGKGISGGRVIIYPFKSCGYKPEENIIIGNTSFYGAIKGEAYIRGVAGERFCIRNSGLCAVVEGVGDHGCEYMTGGRVVILGKTGRNFAAGMSGGIAYVYDEDDTFRKRCNMDMVEFDDFKYEDALMVSKLVSRHYSYTGSCLAKEIIGNFEHFSKRFVKVMPKEYKRVLEHQAVAEEIVLGEVSDG